MIPSNNGFLLNNFETIEQTSRTYKLNNKNINGFIDDYEAVFQCVYKILNTERYQYPIYSHNYGIELADLYGEPISYVCSELKRRITEALMQDTRIEAVDTFIFETQNGKIHASFVVQTIFGKAQAEKDFNINQEVTI